MTKQSQKAECEECGKVFARIDDLKDVHSVGLALVGTCPDCCGRVWCETLWKCSKRGEMTPKVEANLPAVRSRILG